MVVCNQGIVVWYAEWDHEHDQLGYAGRGRYLTTGVVGDPPVGGGTPGEALGLASDCHDELLQADTCHALRQITVSATDMYDLTTLCLLT